jgi:hypothetical protein
VGFVPVYMLGPPNKEKLCRMADVLSQSGVVVCSQKGGSKIASVDRSLTSCGTSFGAGCDHRHHSLRMVFTELGCHARCLGCGALGPGCSSSKAAQQALLGPKLAQTLARY